MPCRVSTYGQRNHTPNCILPGIHTPYKGGKTSIYLCSDIYRINYNVYRKSSGIYRKSYNIYRKSSDIYRKSYNIYRKSYNAYRITYNAYYRSYNTYYKSYQSAGENAGPALRGWPEGVKNILIVINDVEGPTEVYRQLSPRLYNDIKMPANSHGKQFIIRAAFLRHIDDAPRFGNEPTFTMPRTTLDLATQQAREIERLRAELKVAEM